jgi:hypothetical protein
MPSQNLKKTFSYDRLKKSILANAMSINLPEGQAEEISNIACGYVLDWLKDRSEVTNDDIQRITTKKINELCPDLAYIYSSNGQII